MTKATKPSHIVFTRVKPQKKCTDLGVTMGKEQIVLIRVRHTPEGMQYKFNDRTGVYTFPAKLAKKRLEISTLNTPPMGIFFNPG